jgi:hypothetical protein
MVKKKSSGIRNIVVFKEPKFKPMPGELTPAVINGATLPVKVEAAKRAIAACCDLSELLTWKDKLAALAAAAKMARMPEMARDVNRVHKEAIFRMGEILLQYKGHGIRWGQKADGSKKAIKGGCGKSERAKAATHAGIDLRAASMAVRVASAPAVIREKILEEDSIPPQVHVMARSTPRRTKISGIAKAQENSDMAMLFFSGYSREHLLTKSGSSRGFTGAASALRCVDLASVACLTPEEKQRARKIIVEMQEILDEIDRRLGPA